MAIDIIVITDEYAGQTGAVRPDSDYELCISHVTTREFHSFNSVAINT